MKSASIQVIPLYNSGDGRGSSFSLPDTWQEFIGSVLELHPMTLRPNQLLVLCYSSPKIQPMPC